MKRLKFSVLIVVCMFAVLMADYAVTDRPVEFVRYQLKLPARPKPERAEYAHEKQEVNPNIWMRWGLVLDKQGRFVECGPQCLD